MRELVKQAKTDSAARLEILERFEPLIKKTIRHYSKDFSLYNDAMQEGYATVLRCIELFKTESDIEFAGYVKAAINNNLMNYFRKIPLLYSLDIEIDDAEDLTPLDMLPSGVNIEQDYMKQQQRAALYDAINHLPARHRSIIIAIYFHHRTMRSLCNEYDCHYNTIVNTKEAALKQIRKHMAEML